MDEKIAPASAGTSPLCLPDGLRKPRLRRFEAVRYLELVHGIVYAVSTFEKFASIGGGPSFHRMNGTPLYPVVELDRWALNKLGHLRTSTSDSGAQQ